MPSSDLPPNNPDALIEELRVQLGHPDVRAFLHAWGHGKVDIKFRVSRRRVASGPVLAFEAKVKRS